MNHASQIKIIDIHCHLDFPEFDPDREEVINRSHQEGLEYMINIGSSINSSRASLELARRYAFIYATVGIHPHEADNFNPPDEATIRSLAQDEKVVAIGEVGLDYYRNYSGQENQKRLFLALVKIAKDLGLPLVIHSRQSGSEVLEILRAQMPVRAVVHCFSGDQDFLKGCLDLGFFVSFTCNITYKKAQDLREMARIIPLERIFLETDAPYLSPEGLRGRRNIPLNTRYVAEEIALLKQMDTAAVARITTESAKKFFSLR